MLLFVINSISSFHQENTLASSVVARFLYTHACKKTYALWSMKPYNLTLSFQCFRDPYGVLLVDSLAVATITPHCWISPWRLYGIITHHHPQELYLLVCNTERIIINPSICIHCTNFSFLASINFLYYKWGEFVKIGRKFSFDTLKPSLHE